MHSYLQFVTSPSVDTPGTLLLLHFDAKRYLIGNLSEGTSRAGVQHGLALRKIDDAFITGRTRWANIGGLLGFVLNSADVKKSAAGSVAQNQGSNANTQASRSSKSVKLNLHGAKNLNYAIATARRFIFRTGQLLTAIEHPSAMASSPDKTSKIEPTWADDNILVWSMALCPSDKPGDSPAPKHLGGRKRSYDQMLSAQGEARASFEEAQPTNIVQQMFNSDWKMDRLVEQPLRDVQLPATLFVRDEETGKLVQYTGPMPGSEGEVPDVNVLVRRPWPGATTEKIPPTLPSEDSICYIVRNHPQRGRFLPKRAEELKVRPRSLYSKLANGKTVQNDDGKEITPDMVLEPGKQGGGFVVADIPSIAYIPSFEARPELIDASVMDGIGAFVWILGPGVIQDHRIQAFQERFAHLEHVVAAPELADDGFTLRAAARSAWINHSVDPESFPTLVEDSLHLAKERISASYEDQGRRFTLAQRGVTITLEPHVEVTDSIGQPPVSRNQTVKEVKVEYDSIVKEIGPLPNENKIDGDEWPREAEYKDVEVLSLGTGSSHPALVRNVSGTLLRVPGCGSYVLDAGEGTLGTLQRMYTKAELDDVLRDMRMIWISHMHADHHLGLTSLIRAWYEAVHGSRPGPDIMSAGVESAEGPLLGIVSDSPMLHWLYEYSAVEDFGYSRLLPLATRPTTDAQNADRRIPTQLHFAREEPGTDEQEASVATSRHLSRMNLAELSTVKVAHCRGAQAITLQTTNGFRASYSGDCRPSADFAAIGADSHLLIHEATFEDEMRDEAVAKRHSTAGEALVVARAMRAQAVILTHFSQRYPKMPPLGTSSAAGLEATTPVHGALAALIQSQGIISTTADAQANAVANAVANAAATTDVEQEEYDEDDDIPPAATDEAGPLPSGARPAARAPDTVPNGTGNAPGAAPLGALSIARLLADGGPRVVMAFDYMRLRLRHLPRLEAKQPALRAVYDALEARKEAERAANAAGGEGSKQRKKAEAVERKRERARAAREDDGGLLGQVQVKKRKSMDDGPPAAVAAADAAAAPSSTDDGDGAAAVTTQAQEGTARQNGS